MSPLQHVGVADVWPPSELQRSSALVTNNACMPLAVETGCHLPTVPLLLLLLLQPLLFMLYWPALVPAPEAVLPAP